MMLDRESRCSCVAHFLLYRGLATRSRLPSYLFLILPDLLTILIRTHGHYSPPQCHVWSSCQLIPYSLTTRPASMSGLGDTLIAPWYTHPLHDTVSSLMSHLGSTPRYSVACSSPKAGIVLRVSCIHYIAMFPRQHHTYLLLFATRRCPGSTQPPP